MNTPEAPTEAPRPHSVRFEYIGEKRRTYAQSAKAKRSRILDEVCETLGYTRKYVIKLLTGNIRYRERKGRGRTYGTSALARLS